MIFNNQIFIILDLLELSYKGESKSNISFIISTLIKKFF